MSETPPPMIGGRYRVIRELGRGGMGAVYLVEHIHTGENLALKVLLGQEATHPEAVERFKREARAPAKIKSDHVVRVTDADVAPELNGAPFMVMEALNGKDFGEILLARGAIPAPEVAWILQEIAATLDKAHGLGIVHRDLKPENLFLHTKDDGSKIVKLLDFGISRVLESDAKGGMASAGLTKTGAMMGTPLFMAPEQARGIAAHIGPGTDVWSLGLVAIRMLSNEIYWDADTLADLMVKILVEPMVPPSIRHPKMPVNVDAWFARACDRNPAARFASVGEQVRAFTNAVGAAGAERPALGSSAVNATVVLGANQTPSPYQPAALQTPTGPQPQPQHPQHVTGPRLEQSSSVNSAFGQFHTTGGLSSAGGPIPGTGGSKTAIIAAGLVGVIALAGAGYLGIHYRPTHSSGHGIASAEPPVPPPPPPLPVAVSVPPVPEPTPTASASVAAKPVPAPVPSHVVAPVIAPVVVAPAPKPAPQPAPQPAPKGKFNPEAP